MPPDTLEMDFDEAAQYMQTPTPAPTVAPTGPLTPASETVELGLDQIAMTPYEDPAMVKAASRIGVGPGEKPIYNLQAVNQELRYLTQMPFDTYKDKAAFLKERLGKGWQIAQSPRDPNDVIVKGPGKNYWGVIDPGGLNLEEMVNEARENPEILVQTLGLSGGPLAQMLLAGGAQTIRQGLKKYLLPEADMSATDIAIDAAAGGVTGLTGQAPKAALELAKTGYDAAKMGASKVVARAADSSMWERVKDIPKMFDSPEWMLREIGATAKDFNDFQKKSLTENVSFLKKNSPEFIEANKALMIADRYQNLKTLLKDTGEQIGQIYNDPNKVVNMQDIFQSEAYQNLKIGLTERVVAKGQQKVRVGREVQQKVGKIRHNMLEQLAETIMPEGPSTGNLLTMFRRNKLHLSDLGKQLGAKTNDDAMEMLLQGEKLPMSDAWAMRMGADELVKYGKAKGSIDSISSARKMVPDALRQSMDKSLRNLLGDGADEVLRQSDVYHNLLPYVATLSKKVARGKEAPFNPLEVLPGWMLSTPRFAMALGRNLLQRPEVAAAIRNGSVKFPMPKGGLYAPAKTGISALGNIIKGGQFNALTGTAEKMLLPRDTDTYFNDPEAINSVINAVGDSELADALVKQFERGDRESFSNTLSMVAAENEDLFNKAPYKSLVMNNGKQVITDMYEREQHRQFINKQITDPVQRYRSLQALNYKNEIIDVPYEVPKEFTIKKKGTTTLQRVSNNLKKVDTVKLDDGEERVDYDY